MFSARKQLLARDSVRWTSQVPVQAAARNGLTPSAAMAPPAPARAAGGAVVHSREETVTKLGSTLTAALPGTVFHGQVIDL